MTCAHVVNVALKKVAGVESVDVSLNKGVATVKLKAGNGVTVSQLWQLIHEKGYSPKATTISVRGSIASAQGQLQLKVSGSGEVLPLAADQKNLQAFEGVSKNIGKAVSVEGLMLPEKNLKARVPLHVTRMGL